MRRVLTPGRCGGLAAVALLVAVATACGSDGPDPGDGTGRPSIVVTTNVLGDVVTAGLGEMVGTSVDVTVVVPIGADPHEFAVSARQAEAMENADLLVVNGLGAEAGMADVIANVADGSTPVFSITDQLGDALIAGDPHVWLDPTLVATSLAALEQALVDTVGLDAAAVSRNMTAYRTQLVDLDAAVEAILAEVPPPRRTLVTNHDSLAYFARRYGLTVVGTIIPSVGTGAAPSASDLEELAASIVRAGVPAVFAETTESDRLAQALADEVGGDIDVVELFTGSLGGAGSGAETYLDAMTLNAQRIARALTP